MGNSLKESGAIVLFFLAVLAVRDRAIPHPAPIAAYFITFFAFHVWFTYLNPVFAIALVTSSLFHIGNIMHRILTERSCNNSAPETQKVKNP